MVEPVYITDVQAWLTPEQPAEASPTPLSTEEASPRLCRGCGEPLPPIRKGFHDNVCKGKFLSRNNVGSKRPRKDKKNA